MSPSSTSAAGDIELAAISIQNPPDEAESTNPFDTPSASQTFDFPVSSSSSSDPRSSNTQPASSHQSVNEPEGEEQGAINPTEALPPVDSGRQAWLFLIAATYIELIIWGLPFSIGVLHVYWLNTLFKGQGESTITLAATLQTGLSYMTVAVSGPIFTTFPRYTKTLQLVGLMMASISMIASAFVTKPWHLIVTIGVFYPMASATYFPCATWLFEWFHARRGLASGVMYSGTGLGGFVFPFLMQGLLGRFGYKTAMISLGLGYTITGNIALLAIKRRIPLSRYEQNSMTPRRRPRVDWSFIRRSALYLAISTIGLTSMGNFIPNLWLPSFVDEMGMTKPNGTVLIAILNAASVPGNALLGYLSDKLPLKWTVLISCLGSALSCAFLWGFGTNSGVLVSFAVTFGLLGLSFTTLWTKMVGAVSRDDPVVTGLTYSIFAFMRGVGNMSSGPISDQLLKVGVLRGATGAYGFHNYGILLIYTAVTILSGGVTGLMLKE
ncbi:monocarboxylic acid transporter [Kwoniella mangroviensis CBS 8886]|nr:monocarboxylic acid transporter [Kwoniella mangroviensis CBS 8886]